MNQLSLDQVIDAALQSFSEELAKTEIQIFQRRNSWRAKCKMTAYFQSTPEKAAFSRLMYLATCVKQPYTITEICNELGISRQTICIYTDDCCKEGWIVWEKVAGNSYKYMASQELCDGILAYADYASDMFLKGDVHDTEHFLRTVKRRKAALRCQN
jgi:hypothetical protein